MSNFRCNSCKTVVTPHVVEREETRWVYVTDEHRSRSGRRLGTTTRPVQETRIVRVNVCPHCGRQVDSGIRRAARSVGNVITAGFLIVFFGSLGTGLVIGMIGPSRERSAKPSTPAAPTRSSPSEEAVEGELDTVVVTAEQTVIRDKPGGKAIIKAAKGQLTNTRRGARAVNGWLEVIGTSGRRAYVKAEDVEPYDPADHRYDHLPSAW